MDSPDLQQSSSASPAPEALKFADTLLGDPVFAAAATAAAMTRDECTLRLRDLK